MTSYSEYRGPPAPEEYPYPPQGMPYNGNILHPNKATDDDRSIRTPSPTPSEVSSLRAGVDWKRMRSWRFWFKREWLWYYVALVVIVVLSALMTIYHTQIVHWLTPFANWLHRQQAGWLVPIAILFVISFPPLFGHEVVAVLCGLVWGLWIGFAIVVAGSFLGEVGNFYAFKYCCRARAEKLEKTNIRYACLTKAVRDGGFKIALIARLSAIPGHFTTAVFSTCGMGIITFSIAAILSMPKQFVTVYLGVILEQSGSASQNKKSKIISDVVLAVTILVTILAMWYILHKMNLYKPEVIYARRKARQVKIARGDFMPYSHAEAMETSSNTVFDPELSESDIPLTGELYQRWDKEGRAVGYADDPRLHAPQPKHAPRLPSERIPAGRDYGSSVDDVDSIEWDDTRAGSQPLDQADYGGRPPPSPLQIPGRTNYTRTPEAAGDGYGAQDDDDYSAEVSPTVLGQKAFSSPPSSYRTDIR